MATKYQSTGTATDWLGYVDYHDTAGYDYIDRLPSTRQEWVFGDWDGEKYLIKFANNFSKKHLFTFEKKKADVEVAAYYQSQKGGSPAENWRDAEHQLLEQGIVYKLTARTEAGQRCLCGHEHKQHNKLTAKCMMSKCAYKEFGTAYGAVRRIAGRPDVNPLGGQATSENTCIVLNYIPKTEFESVVVGSICVEEKPPGWTRGQPLRKPVGAKVELRWDFGPARLGAVIQAVDGQPPSTWTRLRGVYVEAEKIATAVGWQTWQIYHLMTKAPYAPF